MMPLFVRVERAVAISGEMPALDELYTRMPRRNFSSGLLARVPDHVAVVEAEGFLWSDWGKPERILDTLAEIGKSPAFPAELVAHASSRADARDPASWVALNLSLRLSAS